MSSQKLKDRKKNPNDEQYTMYEDIAKEMATYRPSDFRHKTVYCNCDGIKSNFTRYFRENFTKLGLKRLICTSYGGWAMVMDRDGIREFRLQDGGGGLRLRNVQAVPRTGRYRRDQSPVLPLQEIHRPRGSPLP